MSALDKAPGPPGLPIPHFIAQLQHKVLGTKSFRCWIFCWIFGYLLAYPWMSKVSINYKCTSREEKGLPVQCIVCGEPCVKGESQVNDTENNEFFRMVVSQSGSLLLLGGCVFWGRNAKPWCMLPWDTTFFLQHSSCKFLCICQNLDFNISL